VTERKDVLSGLFFMLTIGAYVRYARRPLSYPRYGMVMLPFAMGLMCKPMLVTVPLVLLLLDYWPLQRKETAGRLMMEKLPLLALSAALCVATMLAQSKSIQSTETVSLPLRLANALATCMVYLGQMVWPAGLAVLYPYPRNGLPLWEVALAGIALAGFSAVALRRRRGQPWLLIGWLWYLITLLPVVGIVQVGTQAHADRYTYLPQIGIYLAITWLVADWRVRWLRHGSLRVAFGGLMAGVLALFMVCAWQQTAYWQNSETLWPCTLACTTDNDIAQDNLGIALFRKGKVDAAIACFQQALQIRPDFAEARNNLGNALLQMGKVDDAIACFQQALQIRPDFAEAHNDLGNALLQTGKVDEAITHCQRALQIKPDDAEACVNLGNALFRKGRVDDAIAQYQKALQIKPGLEMARKNLGAVLLQKSGRPAVP
jgi:tetratricopeptide (TPR) repeat protein